MRVLITILFLYSANLSAQKGIVALGAVNDSSARVVILSDSVKSVHAWKAFTLSDHEGEKDVWDASLIIREGNAYVYRLRYLAPKTPYTFVVIYPDTFQRDTFTTSVTTPQGKLQWWKSGVTWKGQTYNSKYFDKLMKAKARLRETSVKPEHHEH